MTFGTKIELTGCIVAIFFHALAVLIGQYPGEPAASVIIFGILFGWIAIVGGALFDIWD